MAFSGALTLTDLNDFISPSQACIKPVEQKNPPKDVDKGAASTEIVIDSSGAYYEVSSDNLSKPKEKLAKAEISLNDCLACSGCITSAESVLITLQSHTEVLNVLESNKSAARPKVTVASIAPQSLASLAASLSTTSTASVTPRQVLQRVSRFLRDVLGFDRVFDTTFARHIALQEHVNEFVERRELDGQARALAGGDASGSSYLPMLASACPGWICYAEKTHGEMLPFIAKTKSPQQVMGTLVKEWMGRKWSRSPDEVYHVTVMPCYDKKLEASREDFYNDVYSTRDVDCVITTGELDVMMQEKGWDLSVAVSGELDDAVDEDEDVRLPELMQHEGTSSGSYLHAIMGQIRQEWEGKLELSVKMVRNADFEEYRLVDGETVVFKGAKCYGFRNLQNIVRKVGKERGVRTGMGAAGRLGGRRTGVRKGVEEREYDYVEVMACPGGCVNGGGQMKRGKEEGRWGDREWTLKTEEMYWQIGGTGLEGGMEMVEEIRGKLRTGYREVVSGEIGLGVKW